MFAGVYLFRFIRWWNWIKFLQMQLITLNKLVEVAR